MRWLRCSIDVFDEQVPVARTLTITAAGLDAVMAVLRALRDPLRTRAIEEASERLLSQELPGSLASRFAESEDVVDGTMLRLTLEIHGRAPHADGSNQWFVEAICVRRSADVVVEHVVWARALDAIDALRMATGAIASGLDLAEAVRCLAMGLRVAPVSVNGRPAVLRVRGIPTPG